MVMGWTKSRLRFICSFKLFILYAPTWQNLVDGTGSKLVYVWCMYLTNCANPQCPPWAVAGTSPSRCPCCRSPSSSPRSRCPSSRCPPPPGSRTSGPPGPSSPSPGSQVIQSLPQCHKILPERTTLREIWRRNQNFLCRKLPNFSSTLIVRRLSKSIDVKIEELSKC